MINTLKSNQRAAFDELYKWSAEHFVLHSKPATAGGTPQYNLRDSSLANLAVFVTRSQIQVPSQIAGGATARHTNTTVPPTENLRKQAAQLYVLGPVLRHEKLYNASKMKTVLRTVAEGPYPKDSIKSIRPVYGDVKAGQMDRILNEDELKCALYSAAIVTLGGWKPLELGRAWGQIRTKLLQTIKDNEPLDFNLNDLDADLFKRLTVREFLDSPLNRACLPFKRYPAVLGDWEAHSAGCIRCLRTFYEPPYFYSVDTARTAQINLVFAPQRTKEIQDMINRMAALTGTPWPQFATNKKQLTAEEIRVINGTDGVLKDHAQIGRQLILVPSGLLDLTDQFPADTIYAGWRGKKAVVFSRWKNPHTPCDDQWHPFGTSQSAWRAPWNKDAPKILLYRYNSLRAMSNLCYECGKTLDSPALRLIDGYRPMELRFSAPNEVVSRLHNKGLQDRMTKEERELVQSTLQTYPELEQTHVDIITAGGDYELDDIPASLKDVLPFRYINWARNWTKRFKPSEGDLRVPVLDALTLLRMGVISDDEYAALWGGQTGATSLAHKVALDLSVGDARTGLLAPALTADAARAAHKKVLDGIEKLLKPIGRARKLDMPREIVQALRSLAIKHSIALQTVKSAADSMQGAYDPEDAQYEWHRLVRLKKKIWHPGFAPVAPERKTEEQARSVQQSKFFITLVMHRRATLNQKHNEYVLMQMARSVEALFSSPEHVGSLFKFGLTWQGDHWGTWFPRKDGAETTGVGHYMSHQAWLTRDVYKAALLNGPAGVGTDALAEKLVDKFWNVKTDTAYALPEDHPYARKVKGQILPADEYQTDTFDEVMLGMHAQVGCEIGPVARLFHFHMLLDVKHISKIQLDQRAYQSFFLACWRGDLFDGEYAIRDASGNLWIPPHERLHFDLRLHAEDEVAAAMDAYVQKQSMNYMAAGLRSIGQAAARQDKARREDEAEKWFATRAKAVFNQPSKVSRIAAADDGLPTGLTRRAQELTNLPAGSVTTSHARVQQPGLVNRSRVVQATALEKDDSDDDEAQITEYEQARLDTIYRNDMAMFDIGLLSVRPVRRDR